MARQPLTDKEYATYPHVNVANRIASGIALLSAPRDVAVKIAGEFCIVFHESGHVPPSGLGEGVWDRLRAWGWTIDCHEDLYFYRYRAPFSLEMGPG